MGTAAGDTNASVGGPSLTDARIVPPFLQSLEMDVTAATAHIASSANIVMSGFTGGGDPEAVRQD